jgi:hypothetical protein
MRNQAVSNPKESVIHHIEFWLLLFYSLLPGIYKILDNQFYMLFSIPIIFYLLYRNRKNIHLYSYDAPILILFGYILLQSCICLFWPKVNKTGLAMGIYMDVLPMLGYFFAKSFNFERFSKFLLWIIFIHCIIGILLYPPFGIIDNSATIIDQLKSDVIKGRMTSVFGSLGFANLLMMGFILSFFINRRFLIVTSFCLLFAAQRSAWMAAIFSILIYIWAETKQGRLIKGIILLPAICLLFAGFLYFINSYLNIDLEFITYRFERIGNAASERDEQWMRGLYNFENYPLGTGMGQAGQFAARYEDAKTSFKVVADGDYFRILSELGIVGGIFLVMLVIRFFFNLVRMHFKKKEEITIMALTAGSLIQMIGSNISEFYFTNFLFWMIISYFYTIINKKHNKIQHNDFCLYRHL